MKVEQIVRTAARLLCFGQVVEDFFENGDREGEEKSLMLVDCFNCVEKELALDYLPLWAEERVGVEDGCVAYEELSRRPARIKAVKSAQGTAIGFELFPDHIRVQTDGVVVVRYSYIPEDKGADVDVEYQSRVSESVLAYGVAAEYCVRSGLYEEAAVWDKKYKEGIAAACEITRGKWMRSRRWV